MTKEQVEKFYGDGDRIRELNFNYWKPETDIKTIQGKILKEQIEKKIKDN